VKVCRDDGAAVKDKTVEREEDAAAEMQLTGSEAIGVVGISGGAVKRQTWPFLG
jgi:hypothetical protein